MKTIRAFIDSLFNEYEDNPEVRQAKKELYEMMEDKYLDLKSQGKSENEAVGEVIASIGTIEELEEELNFRLKDQKRKDGIYLTANQAEEYLNDRSGFASKISLGVAMCILAVGPLIALLGLDLFNENISLALGLVILLGTIAVAVGIFIKEGIAVSNYENYEVKEIILDEETRIQLGKEQARYRGVFQRKISFGVMLCILAALPVIVTALLFEERENLILIATAFLFLFIAAGAKMIVETSIIKESYDILLEEGEYENKNRSKLLDDIAGVYWTAAVVIYLGWSFTTGDWHYTWIIWPIAGVTFGLVSTVFNILSRDKSGDNRLS